MCFQTLLKLLLFKTAFSLQIIPGVFLLCAILFLPETPRFLALKGKLDESLRVLSRLRGGNPDSPEVQHEFAEIKTTVDRDISIGNATWKELWQPDIRPRVALVIILQFLQQWTGINVILYYAGSLFEGIERFQTELFVI